MFTAAAGQAITASAASFNSIDIGPAGRDLAGADYPKPLVIVDVLTAFASASPTATLTTLLQVAPDAGGVAGIWDTVRSSPAVPLGALAAGLRPVKLGFPPLSELLIPAIQTIFGTFSCASGASTIAVASATGLLPGMFIACAGIFTPGTTISSISGTTVTISSPTLGVASGATFAATPVLATGAGGTQLPRFVQLSFQCSATMIAGSVFAALVLDLDHMPLYGPGFAWKNVVPGYTI